MCIGSSNQLLSIVGFKPSHRVLSSQFLSVSLAGNIAKGRTFGVQSVLNVGFCANAVFEASLTSWVLDVCVFTVSHSKKVKLITF